MPSKRLTRVIDSQDATALAGEADRRVAALIDFHQRRKQDSRERLLAAAMTQFCDQSYLAVSVEDIASAAGVSRVTFYRHFNNKADIAADLFKVAAEAAIPRLLAHRDDGLLESRRRDRVDQESL